MGWAHEGAAISSIATIATWTRVAGLGGGGLGSATACWVMKSLGRLEQSPGRVMESSVWLPQSPGRVLNSPGRLRLERS